MVEGMLFSRKLSVESSQRKENDAETRWCRMRALEMGMEQLEMAMSFISCHTQQKIRDEIAIRFPNVEYIYIYIYMNIWG